LLARGELTDQVKLKTLAVVRLQDEGQTVRSGVNGAGLGAYPARTRA
jgi:hypothetical protein